MLIALALAVTAGAAYPCTTPAKGTMEDVMAQAVYTKLAGSRLTRWRGPVDVSIKLPALAALPDTGCLRWSVTLRLPDVVTADPDAEGATTALTQTNLATSAKASFRLRFSPQILRSIYVHRAWLEVRVRRSDADPGVTLARPDGSPRWLYPVDFQLEHNW